MAPDGEEMLSGNSGFAAAGPDPGLPSTSGREAECTLGTSRGPAPGLPGFQPAYHQYDLHVTNLSVPQFTPL